MNIIKLPSQNCYQPAQMTERAVWSVVAHGTASADAWSAIGWLRNPKSGVSANYVISKTGVIYELVDWQAGRRAWANGIVDAINYDRSLKWLNDCVRRKINPNWHTVSIEHEATDPEMRRQASMTDAQFNASIDLTAYIMRLANLKASHETYVTHHQIAGAAKPTCPGVIFPPAFLEVLIDRNPDLKP